MTIRPAYRFGLFIGFCVVADEPIGKAMPYKFCVLLLRQLEAK